MPNYSLNKKQNACLVFQCFNPHNAKNICFEVLQKIEINLIIQRFREEIEEIEGIQHINSINDFEDSIV
jgi:hypothetical protein